MLKTPPPGTGAPSPGGGVGVPAAGVSRLTVPAAYPSLFGGAPLAVNADGSSIGPPRRVDVNPASIIENPRDVPAPPPSVFDFLLGGGSGAAGGGGGAHGGSGPAQAQRRVTTTSSTPIPLSLLPDITMRDFAPYLAEQEAARVRARLTKEQAAPEAERRGGAAAAAAAAVVPPTQPAPHAPAAAGGGPQ
jgi:hypothetical protein